MRLIPHHPYARSGILALAASFFLAGALPLCAQKTDILVLYQGDSITGEVKELNRGKLSYKTDHMGTLSVKWDKVAHLTSTNYFDVVDRYGARHFGQLAASEEPGQLLIILADTVRVRMIDLVAMSRIRADFWSRLDGYVDIGFDFQKAKRNRQLNSSALVKYRTQRWASQVSGTTYYQRQEGTDGTSRNDLGLLGQRLFGNHWSALAFASFEQNQEISLDLRQTYGLGATREVVHSNALIFQIVGALAYANEKFATAEGATNTIQVPISADFAFFRFDSPKTDVTASLTVTPILTDLGRWRMDFSTRLSYELISDFTIGFRFFDNFDSRSPSGTGSTNDYGLTFSIGYTF
ncbi:MAG: DUF481 domain-containing protein [Gemmatimonadota bacterium]